MRSIALAVYHGCRNAPCIDITFIVTPVDMKTANQIIDLCGGTSSLAKALKLTPSTVSSWREVNFIPRWWQDGVITVAKAAGEIVASKDFPTKKERITRSKPALEREAASIGLPCREVLPHCPLCDTSTPGDIAACTCVDCPAREREAA